MVTRRFHAAVLYSGVCALVALALGSQPCAAAPDVEDLEAFVDGAVASVATQRIGGVAVAIVLNGAPLSIKGYGLSAIAPERTVDPQRTLFRLASVSKTFTWLAVMQLVEQGKLRLEDPVNAHLPASLAIPSDGWTHPIRVVDLMNHTAGFEDTGQPAAAHARTELRSLSTDLRTLRPARVREPARVSVYSNYGARLAGAIVAHASGVDFETYIEQHILQPLQMQHTTFREAYSGKRASDLPEPMPKELAVDRASGIEWEGGAWKAFPHAHIMSDAPAGSASSTAADMASYMIALLDPAVLERAGVLRAATHTRMMSESFRPGPGVRGIHHGFFDEPTGARAPLGYANISHNGFIPHFPSSLRMFPELGLGVFVVSNSSSGEKLTSMLSELILRRYFPPPPQQPTAGKPVRADLSEYAGDYRPLRRNYTKLEALFSISQVVRVATSDGYLVVGDRPDGAVRFAQLERDLFQKIDGDARIAFERDGDGRITRIVGAVNADPIRFYQTLWWLRSWLLASLAAACGVLAGAWFRARRRGSIPVEPQSSCRAAAYLTLTAAVWLGFHAAAMIWEHVDANTDVWNGYPQPVLKLALSLLLAAVLLTAAALGLLPWVWRASDWSLGRRLRHTAVIFLFAMTVITVHQWNAIGFKYF